MLFLPKPYLARLIEFLKLTIPTLLRIEIDLIVAFIEGGRSARLW